MDFHEEHLPDEEEPESLRRKWQDEEMEEQIRGKRMIDCPHCGKPIESKSFFCFYCGRRVFSASGLLGKMGQWMREGRLFFLVFLVLLCLFLFAVLF